LHYLEFPRDAPSVIVLPGITMPAATWEFVGHRLAQNFHVILVDNLGRGLSQTTAAMSYQLNGYARWTVDRGNDRDDGTVRSYSTPFTSS
jgi:N-formylmaleamate deformylase